MPPWILVTPSSRGIGLALSRRLLRTTQLPIVATARRDLDKTREAILSPKAEDGEQELSFEEKIDESRLHVLKLDVTDESTIASAASQCSTLFPTKPSSTPDSTPSHLHLALTLPGILHPEKSPAQLEHSHLLSTFAVNAIGPLLLMKHFTPFLPRKSASSPLLPQHLQSPDLNAETALYAALSARVGSISDNTSLGGWYSYRSSKAAVNQSVRTLDLYLKNTAGPRAMAVGLHPGTVKTGLSKEFWAGVKEGKLFSPGFAAGKLVEVLKGLGGEGRSGAGRCWDWKGEEIMP